MTPETRIRVTLARTPVPSVLHTRLKPPRRLVIAVKEVIGFVYRLLDQTLPPVPFVKKPKARGPPQVKRG